VSREEFDLYDAVKTMSALSLMFFCKMMAMGKCGKKAAWGNSSKITKKMAKLSLGAVMLMMVLSMFLSHEGKHIMEVSERAQRHHRPQPHPRPHHKEDGEEEEAQWMQMEPEFPEGRNLKSYAFFLQQPNNDCKSYSSEGTCNSAKCSWCKSAAVKSACNFPADAAKLPPAVFDCSNLPTVEKKPVKIPI
jgi:hypothetical protein